MKYTRETWPRFLVPTAMLVCSVCMALDPGTLAEDLAVLRQGVSAVNASGIPGPVSAFGPEAFAVVVGRDGNARLPVVVATRYGKGRAMAFGKGEFFTSGALEDADNLRFLTNSFAWAGGVPNPKVGVVGDKSFAVALKAKGVRVVSVAADRLGAVDVVVVRPARLDAEAVRALRVAVHGGKGLLAGCLGWGWKQLNPGKSLAEDHQGNQLLAPMGLLWLNGMLKRTTPDGKAYAVGKLPNFTNASHALDAALAERAGTGSIAEADRIQASLLLSRTAQALPPGDLLLLPRVRALLDDAEIVAVPSPENPLCEWDLLPRLVLTLQLRKLAKLPPGEVLAHPAAASFPGAVPEDAERVTRETRVVPAIPKWCSTALYAAPGDLVTVTFPAEFAKNGYKIRIGSTTCNLWSKAVWTRAPQVTRTFAVKAATTKIASPFGGLLYVVVPKDAPGAPFDVRFENVVPAPSFRMGQTSNAQWKADIRDLPAPRAELISGKAILTVPSKFVRKLDDPEKLMRVWGQINDLCGELACWEPGERGFPQRYTADCQLCAGYMHAGHPIMIPISTADELTDVEQLLEKGNWGFFHETGHNHQNRAWTFGGTGEVTVNLFTMYVYDKLCGIPPEKGRMGGAVPKSVHVYFAGGTDFAQWKKKPFLALYMYYQLQQKFGWEAYRKVFADYRAQPAEALPKNDNEKRDQWMVRFSRAVARDLGPFFAMWGVPVSAAARASIAPLPDWMPEGFPPPDPRSKRSSPKATAVSASSATSRSPASNAVDGFADTMWHTRWRGTAPRHPHEIVVDLGETMTICGVTCLPRWKGENGRIRRCEVRLGMDGKKWGAPVPATFPASREMQRIMLPTSVACRYLRLTVLEGFDDKPWASIAELDVIR
ncbi:MAG: M60 family metallopeptidase [Lentisphaeria bacterium]|nr:M60 family metallopeptidase [Lentisphaeria bacterium]